MFTTNLPSKVILIRYCNYLKQKLLSTALRPEIKFEVQVTWCFLNLLEYRARSLPQQWATLWSADLTELQENLDWMSNDPGKWYTFYYFLLFKKYKNRKKFFFFLFASRGARLKWFYQFHGVKLLLYAIGAFFSLR